jgi:hypothetical protein
MPHQVAAALTGLVGADETKGLDRWLIANTEIWWEEPSGATLVTTLGSGRWTRRSSAVTLPSGSDALLLGQDFDDDARPTSWFALRRRGPAEACYVPAYVD